MINGEGPQGRKSIALELLCCLFVYFICLYLKMHFILLIFCLHMLKNRHIFSYAQCQPHIFERTDASQLDVASTAPRAGAVTSSTNYSNAHAVAVDRTDVVVDMMLDNPSALVALADLVRNDPACALARLSTSVGGLARALSPAALINLCRVEFERRWKRVTRVKVGSGKRKPLYISGILTINLN